MSDGTDRLGLAKWILERNLSWIAAAEVKVGVIVGIDTGMLGALASAFSGATPAARTPWAWVLTIIALVCLGAGVLWAAMSVVPRLSGPASSFIFFGRVAELSSADYLDKFRRASVEALLEDCLMQAHRNAEIAKRKFQCVQAAMLWSFVAVIPWVAALACLRR